MVTNCFILKNKNSRKIYDTNFDNIHNALTTLFIVTTLENWPEIMY